MCIYFSNISHRIHKSEYFKKPNLHFSWRMASSLHGFTWWPALNLVFYTRWTKKNLSFTLPLIILMPTKHWNVGTPVTLCQNCQLLDFLFSFIPFVFVDVSLTESLTQCQCFLLVRIHWLMIIRQIIRCSVFLWFVCHEWNSLHGRVLRWEITFSCQPIISMLVFTCSTLCWTDQHRYFELP